MFLDEELEQILFAKELRTKEDAAKLARDFLQCMINRIPILMKYQHTII